VDKIQKALRKLTSKERQWVKGILEQLSSGDTRSLDIKKLKGQDDVFRVRKGDIRIIYRKSKNQNIFLLTIERRRKDTYM